MLLQIGLHFFTPQVFLFSILITARSWTISLEKWCTERAAACSHFRFWYIILQLELYVMIYMRATREGDFQLYVEALSKIIPWFFALGHTHYARWIPVYVT